MAGKINNTPAEQEYMVCIRVTGRVYVPVKAKNIDEARCKANDAVSEMDFGPLEDIDWTAVHVEDEKDNRTYYD